MDTRLIVELPVLAGEMTDPNNPVVGKTLFEGYANTEGVFKGKPVTGFGVAEQAGIF
jgi:hypothetical protein